ncbi:MAG: hypothetical protein NT169_00425 [Chloroflexi bacterium]|nr:hypothetical protein [Chloroflexota bacterium]
MRLEWDERNMSASMTDWDRVAAMRDEDIDFSEIPEITAEQMARARLRVGRRLMGSRLKAADEMLPEYDFSGAVRGKFYMPLHEGYTVYVHKADGTTIVNHYAPVLAKQVLPESEEADTFRSPRFQALLAQSRQSIQECKGLSEDDFWAAVDERYSKKTVDDIASEGEEKRERLSIEE